jgi:hypothetical protein
MANAFANCDGLTVIPSLDTRSCTNLSSIFYGSSNLVRVEGIDMRSVSGD